VTFSIVAQCAESRAFGIAVCSSSPAVGARCIHLRHGVGGSASQNVTDPRLGGWLLELMQEGRSAVDAVDILVAREPFIEFRQLSAVDMNGGSAVFSGQHSLGIYGQRSQENIAVVGNLLSSIDVVDAIVDGFTTSSGMTLADKLLDALSSAILAGGEAGPESSAALMVSSDAGWPETDLRVDYHVDPVVQLKHLWQMWSPVRQDYIARGLDPTTAPAFGVPGEQ